MSLPLRDTLVSYPIGAVRGDARVVHVEPVGDRFAVFLDETPVHPVDAAWPDQGPDRARLTWESGSAEVLDAVIAATDGTSVFLGADVPVRKGTDGWAFLVAHLVAEAPPMGAVVAINVDPQFRRALSLGHTACHLAALALNHALTHRWTKQITPDGLGSGDFDAVASASSSITEMGSLDSYRIGKSLRKKGFRVDGLAEELPTIETAVNAALAEWIGTDATVRIDRDGASLTDRRYWVCSFPDREVRIPCGGTHAGSLGELGVATARLTLTEVDGGLELTMSTRLE